MESSDRISNELPLSLNMQGNVSGEEGLVTAEEVGEKERGLEEVAAEGILTEMEFPRWLDSHLESIINPSLDPSRQELQVTTSSSSFPNLEQASPESSLGLSQIEPPVTSYLLLDDSQQSEPLLGPPSSSSSPFSYPSTSSFTSHQSQVNTFPLAEITSPLTPPDPIPGSDLGWLQGSSTASSSIPTSFNDPIASTSTFNSFNNQDPFYQPQPTQGYPVFVPRPHHYPASSPIWVSPFSHGKAVMAIPDPYPDDLDEKITYRTHSRFRIACVPCRTSKRKCFPQQGNKPGDGMCEPCRKRFVSEAHCRYEDTEKAKKFKSNMARGLPAHHPEEDDEDLVEEIVRDDIGNPIGKRKRKRVSEDFLPDPDVISRRPKARTETTLFRPDPRSIRPRVQRPNDNPYQNPPHSYPYFHPSNERWNFIPYRPYPNPYWNPVAEWPNPLHFFDWNQPQDMNFNEISNHFFHLPDFSTQSQPFYASNLALTQGNGDDEWQRQNPFPFQGSNHGLDFNFPPFPY